MARDRELVEPNPDDKRYVRRDEQGRFTDSRDEVGQSLSKDRRQQAKTQSNKGQGDRGDRQQSQHK